MHLDSRTYDGGPEAVAVTVFAGVVALLALRGRLGTLGPLGALVLFGLAASPADAWLLDSSFVYLLVMIGTVRGAGLPVDLTVEGTTRKLPPGTDLAAYRVVQEALTNALRHAGPARAWVRVHWRGDELTLEVTNDGRTSPEGNGYGQVGMQERLRLYGGGLESGARPEGGYVVGARLPIGPVS